MEKMSICWPENCTNDSNNFHNCEEFIAERLVKIDYNVIEKLYNNLCVEFNKDKIDSITMIEWTKAVDFLFNRLIFEFFWCKNLAKIIEEINIINWSIWTNKNTNTILIYQKNKIKSILYWFKENFLNLLKISMEFTEKRDTDIFNNFLIKIDAIYKITWFNINEI